MSNENADENQLREELNTLRNKYHFWNDFISEFITTLLIAFIFGSLAGWVNVNNIKSTILSPFIILAVLVAVFKFASLKASNHDYNKMKLVEDKLEKIKEAKSKCEEMTVLEAELNEMKLIRAELEKINSAVQPNSKK